MNRKRPGRRHRDKGKKEYESERGCAHATGGALGDAGISHRFSRRFLHEVRQATRLLRLGTRPVWLRKFGAGIQDDWQNAWIAHRNPRLSSTEKRRGFRSV